MTVLTVDEVAQGEARWECLFCGQSKESGKPFCITCYRALPVKERRKMFRRAMDQVAAGVNACRAWLAVNAAQGEAAADRDEV